MEKPFSAFISYSRKDLSVARWLHTKLEKYPYPQDLTRPEYKPYDDKLYRPVFLDLKDLSPTEHPFNEKIKEAIEKSRFLILDTGLQRELRQIGICGQGSALFPKNSRQRLHQGGAILHGQG